jgi:hypothetical protein
VPQLGLQDSGAADPLDEALGQFEQQIEVCDTVPILEEHGLSIIAAMDKVQRQGGMETRGIRGMLPACA